MALIIAVTLCRLHWAGTWWRGGQNGCPEGTWTGGRWPGCTLLHPVLSSLSLFRAPGKSEVERWSDMYTVTSQLLLKVGREDDGVPVICLVDHPAVKDLQTQRYLEVMCE